MLNKINYEKKFYRCTDRIQNQAVLGEVEICPLEIAREQIEIMFWGPVHICKEVSSGLLVKKISEQCLKLHRLLGNPYFP